jgi:hypothetical protein
MANKGEQLEKGFSEFFGKNERKEAKKQQTRLKRRESKNIDNENPQYNKYKGWRL